MVERVRDVPVIDLAGARGGDLAERRRVARAIDEAPTTLGRVYAQNRIDRLGANPLECSRVHLVAVEWHWGSHTGPHRADCFVRFP